MCCDSLKTCMGFVVEKVALWQVFLLSAVVLSCQCLASAPCSFFIRYVCKM